MLGEQVPDGTWLEERFVDILAGDGVSMLLREGGVLEFDVIDEGKHWLVEGVRSVFAKERCHLSGVVMRDRVFVVTERGRCFEVGESGVAVVECGGAKIERVAATRRHVYALVAQSMVVEMTDDGGVRVLPQLATARVSDLQSVGTGCVALAGQCDDVNLEIARYAFDNPLFADLKFVSEGRTLMAHSVIVFTRCPALRTAEVEIVVDEAYDVWVELVYFLYANRVRKEDEILVERLTLLAERYNVDGLRQVCREYRTTKLLLRSVIATDLSTTLQIPYEVRVALAHSSCINTLRDRTMRRSAM